MKNHKNNLHYYKERGKYNIYNLHDIYRENMFKQVETDNPKGPNNLAVRLINIIDNEESITLLKEDQDNLKVFLKFILI